MSAALLEVHGLRKSFRAGHGEIRAVDGVDLAVGRGEVVGLVGESGSGKTTLGRAVLRLIEPDAGTIAFDGVDVRALGARDLRRLRRRMQIVFQDAGAALNPAMTVGALVGEPLLVHGLAKGHALLDRVEALLVEVGLDPADARRHPGEFSGGQRQRIGIARALGLRPDFVVCDEPVAALDVSIQAQVVNLLADLQRRHGTAYLFVAHDLDLVTHFCDRVVVMYRGAVVEDGPASAIGLAPMHPYTRTLFASTAARTGGPGVSSVAVPGSGAGAPGCRYRERCAHAEERCRREEPALRTLGTTHRAACHFAEQIAARAPSPSEGQESGGAASPERTTKEKGRP